MNKVKRRTSTFFLSMALQLVDTGQYDLALVALHLTIQLVPTARVLDYQGVLFSLLYRRENALKSFERALSFPSSPHTQAEIFFHRALLYGREGSFDAALIDCATASRLVPGDSTYQEALEYLRKERQHHEDALTTHAFDQGGVSEVVPC